MSEPTELAPYTEKASRLELIVRWFYGIAIGIVFWLWGIWISIVHFCHFWYILISGRRSPTLYRHTRRYVNAGAYVASYQLYLTDKRPTLTPNVILFYKQVEEIPRPTTTKFCISCRAELPEEASFCPSCGAKQT